jgi:hypothetical protein
LSVTGLISGPHLRVLAGASLEPRLFVTLDLEDCSPHDESHLTNNGPWDDDDSLLSDDGESLLRLARSRMLFYLSLAALPSASRAVVPIGPAVADPGRRRERTGYVTLLETDGSTQEERRLAGQSDSYWRQRRPDERLDMLVGPVPGTDLLIGMSRRLFATCQELALQEIALAREVDDELSAVPPVGRRIIDEPGEDEVAEQQENRRHRYWEREHARRPIFTQRASAAFRRGRLQSWEQLLEPEPRIETSPRPGLLEAATPDTYLAVDARTVTDGDG